MHGIVTEEKKDVQMSPKKSEGKDSEITMDFMQVVNKMRNYFEGLKTIGGVNL
jgi:hypothetical protein